MFVIKVKIKDSERKYDRDFTIYEECKVSQDDPVIAECIDRAIEDFKPDPNDPPDVSYVIKGAVVREG